MTVSGPDALDAFSILAEPLRRRLYDYVVHRGDDVSRAEAAEAVGARRNLVAFHLDKLVEAGLLEIVWRKVTGREGPGSGRPAKLYRRGRHEHTLHLPPRDYGTAAALLAEAVDRAGAEDTLYASAREEGLRRGAAYATRDGGGAGFRDGDGDGDDSAESPGGPVSRDELAHWLEHAGYEPVAALDADAFEAGAADPASADPAAAPPACPALRLRNCPFDAVARSHPPVACGMNLELLRGLLSGVGADAFRADMAPSAEGCCVVISETADSKTNLD